MRQSIKKISVSFAAFFLPFIIVTSANAIDIDFDDFFIEPHSTSLNIVGTFKTGQPINDVPPIIDNNELRIETQISTEQSLVNSYIKNTVPDHLSMGMVSLIPLLSDKPITLERVRELVEDGFKSRDINVEWIFSTTFSDSPDFPIKPGETYYIKTTVFYKQQKLHETEIKSTQTKQANELEDDSTNMAQPMSKRGYTLLAPLGGFPTSIPDSEQCRADPNIEFCNFGDFLNLVIELAIALAAVMLVIKLVISGYSYMTQDLSPYLKLQAKTKITESIIGILLALTAYLILNTINPALVNNDITLERAVLNTLEEDRELDPGDTIEQVIVAVPTGAVAACNTGIEKITTAGGTFYACKLIAPSVKTMIDRAWSEGIKLSGGGFRTRKQQEVLREKHCGGKANIYNSKARCEPPTAYPGRSRHESGLAFDFTCEGKTIKKQDNKCFIWLKNNARTYKLYNFAKEPWHWSIDGK